jgi:hypothetical protein
MMRFAIERACMAEKDFMIDKCICGAQAFSQIGLVFRSPFFAAPESIL